MTEGDNRERRIAYLKEQAEARLRRTMELRAKATELNKRADEEAKQAQECLDTVRILEV